MTKKKLSAEERANSIRNFMNTPISGTPEEMLRYELEFIVAQIKSAEQAAVRMALIESFGPEYRKVRAEAFHSGIEAAAKLCDKPINESLECRIPGNVLAFRIRALSDAGKEVLYSGQCGHHIAMGQPCVDCKRIG